MIEFVCESCSQRQKALREQLGKVVFCPHCSSMSRVVEAGIRFEVTGRTDFHNMGFSPEECEKYERMVKAGYHSGFSRKTPGGKSYNDEKR